MKIGTVDKLIYDFDKDIFILMAKMWPIIKELSAAKTVLSLCESLLRRQRLF